MRCFLIVLVFALGGCVGVPEGIEPVKNFDATRYLGKWYEVARLDHSFERGMQNVTARYSVRKDGGINVINRGFDVKSKKWNEAEGKAYFVEDRNTGHLKVSFFGPFYGSYIVFQLGEDYEYALVTSTNKSYFWLLSRSPTIDRELKGRLVTQVADLGFDAQALIFVDHSKRQPSANQTEGLEDE